MEAAKLAALANKARENACAPYTGHRAGAALLCEDGRVFCGANIEIAGSTASCCALRVAFASAIAAGATAFSAAAATGDEPAPEALLCGVCRQTLAEFCAPDMPVLLVGQAKTEETAVAALLPGWPIRPPRWPQLERQPLPPLGSGSPRELIALAFAGRQRCYTPYSNYHVGAALLAESGRVYTGGNIEPAGRCSVLCAERVALFQAVFAGERSFKAIAVVGGRHGTPAEEFVHANPCAVCRQALCEFDEGGLQFYLAKSTNDYLSMTLDELLPHAFRIGSYR